MDAHEAYEELLDVLYTNGICFENEQTPNDRDKAIEQLLIIKAKLAKKRKYRIVEDDNILIEYKKNGIEGIKKMFNRNGNYLFETTFVYNILFYSYKANWQKVETLIKKYKNGKI